MLFKHMDMRYSLTGTTTCLRGSYLLCSHTVISTWLSTIMSTVKLGHLSNTKQMFLTGAQYNTFELLLGTETFTAVPDTAVTFLVCCCRLLRLQCQALHLFVYQWGLRQCEYKQLRCTAVCLNLLCFTTTQTTQRTHVTKDAAQQTAMQAVQNRASAERLPSTALYTWLTGCRSAAARGRHSRQGGKWG